MGRTHKTVNSNYTDRVIDIDILLYGEESIQTPDLIIPHPLIMQRDFVYRPLFEIAPETEQLLNLKQLNP
jgi:2-amino-4-hydroxy-6-hydroxymethyldihydropteridine diphosphokinase